MCPNIVSPIRKGATHIVPNVSSVNNNNNKGILQIVHIEGQRRELLVDSGSEISIIKQPIEGSTLHPTRIMASGVTGTPIVVRGEQDLECRVESTVFSHRFVVADVVSRADGLMGWDLMRKLGLIIDAAKGSIVQTNRNQLRDVKLVAKENYLEAIRVHTVNKVVIPQFSEVLVKGQLKESWNGDILLEPAVQPQYSVRVARSINKVDRNRVCVKLINLSKEEIVIPKGQYLGMAEDFAATEILEPNVQHKSVDLVQTLVVKTAGTKILINECRNRLAHLNSTEGGKILDVLKKYIHVFEPPGKEGCRLGVYHRIRTTEEGPVVKRPYRVPYHQRPVITEHIHDMLEKDIIRPSESPWSAPVVLVKKKEDGSSVPKYRFCTDFRGLNQITKTDAYPLPLIVETLERMGRSRFFTTLDLASGYHQVPIWPEDQEKTAFTTEGGHFEYKKMPFGLVNAPATFQRLMDQLLAEVKGDECLVYLDDIIVYSATIEEHCQRLEKVLARLDEANLRANIDKCHFAQGEVHYLGHIVSSEGVRPDPKKVDAVVNYPVPKSIKDVKAFLGLAGYYRRFVPGFSNMAKPLTKILRKDEKFKWGDTQQMSFETIKTALCSNAVLIYPDFNDPFILSTDASGVALGAVLSQVREGHERPVAYASRQLNNAEQNYSATERELLAVVWATAQFRCYLLGRKFTLITDHAALKWMLHLKDPSARLARWSLRLMEYNYKVVHRPGVRHQNADGLSRGVAAIDFKFLDDVSFLKEQEEDPWCHDIMTKYPEKVQVGDKGLWYWVEDQSDPETWKVMVPLSLRTFVIKENHDSLWACHPGQTRTVARILERFYWPGLRNDVATYVRNCRSCNTRKSPRGLAVPLGPPLEGTYPFELVSIDIAGPFGPSTKGNQYLLTFVDNFTRYAEAVPLKEQTANEVAEAFVTYIVLRHGAPKKVLTDRGRNFTSDLFKETCRLLGVEKVQTTAYHPAGNGLVERFHRTLWDSLAHMVRKDGADWDRWVPFALAGYRATPHTSTGYSPHHLLYGHKFELPFPCDFSQHRFPGSIKEYVSALKDRLFEIHKNANKSAMEAWKTRSRNYDYGKAMREYQEGELVYLFEPVSRQGQSRKFRHPWSGPHKIVKRMTPWTYRLMLQNGGMYTVHINRLKPAPKKGNEAILTAHHTPDTHRLVSAERELDFQPTSSELGYQEHTDMPNENLESTEESSESENEHQVDDINDDPNWYPESEEDGRSEVQSHYHLRSRVRNQI